MNGPEDHPHHDLARSVLADLPDQLPPEAARGGATLVGVYATGEPGGPPGTGQLMADYLDGDTVVTLNVEPTPDSHRLKMPEVATWELEPGETPEDHVRAVLDHGSPRYAALADRYREEVSPS